MRFAVLGTGAVGNALATKLVGLGHHVTMGSRRAGNDKAVSWVVSAGDRAAEGSFADAASSGEMVLNATAGTASIAALEAAGRENLAAGDLMDLGDITAARGMEMYLALWLRLWGATGTGHLNIRVVTSGAGGPAS